MSGITDKCNLGFTQVEPLITVQQLKERYLFGVDIINDQGEALPDSVYQDYINTAVSIIEHMANLNIMPREILEEKDYFHNDYYDWGYFALNNYPVLDVVKMEIVYLHDNDNNPVEVLDIPKSWIRLNKAEGIIRLIPNNKFPSRLAVDGNLSFFPELFRRQGQVPNIWRITYRCGFEEGKIPVIINTAIGLLAAWFALQPAGDLVVGAGIASSSLSLDGLSQSISTTASAENSAFSARANNFRDQLLGRNAQEPGILKTIVDYYKGSVIHIL